MSITLKAARVNIGLTQEEVAKKIGVSKNTLCNWENAKTFPDAMQIRKLEELYGIDCNQISFLPKATL